MRYSFIALFLILASLTACKVPEEIAKQPTPQKPVAREQVNAIEQRKHMEAMKGNEMDDNHEMAMEKQEDAPVKEVVKAEGSGEYTAYTDGVIGNGQTSVLFFHATWCPACKKNSGLLDSWYGAEDFPRSVYKVDYDTSAALKKQYGITGQDTFVLIDGNGKALERVTFPSQSALRALLG